MLIAHFFLNFLTGKQNPQAFSFLSLNTNSSLSPQGKSLIHRTHFTIDRCLPVMPKWAQTLRHAIHSLGSPSPIHATSAHPCCVSPHLYMLAFPFTDKTLQVVYILFYVSGFCRLHLWDKYAILTVKLAVLKGINLVNYCIMDNCNMIVSFEVYDSC